ncbi:metalloprotease-like protein [Nonomuraea turkmeniaca]|uniref:Metalloprotease-like protein n=1 Tax=Nonomuraea turkmeniaca TaxID=103838 RepID=A0A5S4FRK4_9ACTN|nr:metalloprotease-like protein [Nonomuraea turkmeniaca]
MPSLVKLPTVQSLPLTRALALGVILATACVPAQSAQAAPAAFPKKAGKLAIASCPETAISSGGIPRTREYLQAVVKCLDKSWGTYVKRTRWTFRKPVVLYFEEPRSSVCGVPWPEHAAAFYCTERRTMVFPLTGRWIEDRTDLYPFKVVAHEYGHHLQSLAGVRRAYEARVRSERERQDELKRRYELQADCLAGVFLGSVWGSLDRTARDWETLVDATQGSGDDGDEYRSHGKGATRVYWLKRGYRALSPAACDTWSAPAAKVS